LAKSQPLTVAGERSGRRWTRRALLKAGGAMAVATAATGFYSWQIEPHWVEVTHRPLPVRGLPAELAGKTLIHLSDIHVGPRVDDDYVLHCFDLVRTLEPDLVVMTGDFISFERGIGRHADRVFGALPRGRLGTFGCLGNHDYGARWEHLDVAERVQGVLAAHGLQVLRNERVEIAGLQLVGLEDFWAPTYDPRPVLSNLSAGAPAIVLSHNPDTADEPIWGDFDGWILAGHTHGGQCRPPFLPPPVLPVRNRRYTSGPFEVDGGRRLYVNRGIGHLIQVRFNVRPEIAAFALTPAPV
jgi:predicted MPP superfamily phosphohydrolase